MDMYILYIYIYIYICIYVCMHICIYARILGQPKAGCRNSCNFENISSRCGVFCMIICYVERLI